MRVIFGILIGLSFLSCSRSSLEPKAYIKWVGQEENGLIKVKDVGGLNLAVKYIPNDYLVYKDIKSQKLECSNAVKDSLMEFYKHGYAFLLTMGPTNKEHGDIMMANVGSKEEFNDRVMEMNFNIQEYIHIEVNGKEIYPALASLDNIYGLKNERSIYVLFTDEDGEINKADHYAFVYDDQIFNTGISKFKYLSSDIKSIPEINYKSRIQ